MVFRAIMQYLCNKYDKDNKFYPVIGCDWDLFDKTRHYSRISPILNQVEPEARAKVDYLLNFDLGTLYRAIGEYIYPIWLHDATPDQEKLKVKISKTGE